MSSIVPVWLLVLGAGVAVALTTPRPEVFTWLPVVFGASMIVTFFAQLAVATKEGLVLRVMSTVGGSVLILSVITAVVLIVHA